MKVTKFALIAITAAAILATALSSLAAPVPQKGGPTGGPAPVSDAQIITGTDTHHDTSLPLRDMKPLPIQPRKGADNENPRTFSLLDLQTYLDPVVQTTNPLAMPAPLGSFNGIGYPGVNCNCLPPDTNGDVGPNHYVQSVNTGFQIFNKSGTSLYGPAAINTIWSGFGGACQTSNDGDPVVLYDSLANRWLISQFTATSPYNECIAISQTADPTGAWHRYAFQLSTVDFPDYPHLGVWPDGYYMTVNWFANAATWAGPRPYVFDRVRMLAGQSATFQTTSGALGASIAPLLPSDLDGSTPPPTGAANPFLGTPATSGTLPVYKFHVDWTTPSNTTWTGPINLAGASYTALCATSRACVPQLGTTAKLDGIGDRSMFRAAYRNFGDHESLVGTLNVSSGGVAALRWYELRTLSATPTIYQQGTYQPDTTYRWMGSASMDRQGNLAIGFTASSSAINPQLRYAGRLVTDPLNALSQGEATLYAGAGSQTSTSNRWGDYAAMSVDPTDDCTFWFTSEYYAATSTSSWSTRIGSFKFPGCTSGPTPTPGPTSTTGPTPTATAVPPTATPAPVTNDDFNGATVIGALPFTGNANTTSYTTASDDPALCAGTPATGAHSVWFKYTPGANNTLALDTLTSGYDTVLAVFTGTRGALTRLACNDDAAGGTQSQITGLAVTAGTTYYIEIAAYGSGAGGATVLHVSGTASATSTPTSVPPTATRTPTSIVPTATSVPPTATATGIACPNLGGTYCRTNNEARTWIAGSTATGITGDDQATAVTLPFAFNFMGTSYTSINISSNGNAHFGTSSTAYSNVAVPNTGAPNAMIAAFWDDLNPSAGGAIYTAVSGTAPNRTFTIEWRDVRTYNTGTSGITFEIQLVETSNHIWVLYQDTVFGSTTIDAGLSATSGIENSGGTAGNQYSFNSAALANGLVLHYWKP